MGSRHRNKGAKAQRAEERCPGILAWSEAASEVDPRPLDSEPVGLPRAAVSTRIRRTGLLGDKHLETSLVGQPTSLGRAVPRWDPADVTL